jgi:drug/metabolite transporter (DMT)-like permease
VTIAAAPTAVSRPSATKLLLLFAAMVTTWSLSFVIIKQVAREVPPIILTAIRSVGSVVLLLPVVVWTSRKNSLPRWNWGDVPRLIAVASFGITFNHLFFAVGVSRTSVAHSSLILALMPATVQVLAIVTGQEKAALVRIAGIAIAMSGVALLQLTKGTEGAATLQGDFIMLLAATSFALYTITGKSMTKRYGALYMNLLCFVAGAVSLVPVAYFWGEHVDAGNISVGGWLSLFGYIQPILASVFEPSLLSEPITLWIAAGGVLVFMGVWLAERRTVAA